MEAILVRVLNHEKYNPRKDVVTSSWVRFEHNFFTHPDFIDFTPEERLVWIYILCHASMKKCFAFELSIQHLIHVSSMSASTAKNALRQALEKLQRRQIVKVVTSRGRYADVTQTCSTNERTDERDVTRESATADLIGRLPPLAEVWNQNCGKLPKVQKTNSQRDRRAGLLWKQNQPEEWAAIIKRVANSDFCTGKNERGWMATFDWLLQPEVHLKISEGKYDNRGGTGPKKTTLELLKELERDGSGN